MPPNEPIYIRIPKEPRLPRHLSTSKNKQRETRSPNALEAFRENFLGPQHRQDIMTFSKAGLREVGKTLTAPGKEVAEFAQDPDGYILRRADAMKFVHDNGLQVMKDGVKSVKRTLRQPTMQEAAGLTVGMGMMLVPGGGGPKAARLARQGMTGGLKASFPTITKVRVQTPRWARQGSDTAAQAAFPKIRVVYKTRVANMAELFKSTKLGALSKKQAVKTNYRYQGTSIYKSKRNVKDADGNIILKKNDHFYLDRAHGDHVEVFNKRGQFERVLDLEGRVMKHKTERAEGRTIELSDAGNIGENSRMA